MTFTSEVRVSYIVHMNDDASEVDSFSYLYYQALSSPVLRGESETRLRCLVKVLYTWKFIMRVVNRLYS